MFIWSKGIIVKFLALISDIYSNSKIALVLSVLLPQWNKLLCWQVLIFFSSLKITLFCCFYFKKDLRQDCSVFFCGFFWWFFFFFFFPVIAGLQNTGLQQNYTVNQLCIFLVEIEDLDKNIFLFLITYIENEFNEF